MSRIPEVKSVVALGGGTFVIPAQAEIQRKLLIRFPVVLDKRRPRNWCSCRAVGLSHVVRSLIPSRKLAIPLMRPSLAPNPQSPWNTGRRGRS